MKKVVAILYCLMAYMLIDGQEVLVLAIFPFYYGESGLPGPNEVHIGNTIGIYSHRGVQFKQAYQKTKGCLK